ncbi:hypothetical protein HY251_12130, partial [bacterium]|nr:hypothetical protein [bacterium]
LAGVLAASAVACDYSVALPVAVLALLSLTRGGARSLLAFAGGTVAPALALAAYHQACFGSPWKTAYDFHADPTIAATLSQGAWGFTWPRPRILLELIVGTRRGFLWTQPAALVGLAGLVAAARRERAFALALVAAFLVILANASRARDWDAGASFGARYTTPALPFLALGLPRGLELLGRTARPVALASGALAFVGATSEWGFSVLTSLESIVVLGPRARGLTQIFPGVDPKVVAGPDALAVALLSALAVSSALVLAWLVLQERRRDVAPLVLLPWLACVPVTVSVLSHGPTAVDARFVELTRREARRQIASAEDADTARAIAGVMSWRWRVLGDPGLYTEALDRVLELDPGDERTRALREKWKP